MSPFLFATEATDERQAWGMAQVSEKRSARGLRLDARAEQVLSWLAVLEQTRPASGAVCLADRSLKNKSYCFGVGVAFASGVGVASPLRASLRV